MTKPMIPAMMKLDADGNVERTVGFVEFLKFLNEVTFEYDLKTHPILCQDNQGNKHPYEIFTLEFGKKYIRVVGQKTRDTSGFSRSVYCFLDYYGNIYKSATWKAPAKHIRGTVFDKDYSWGISLGRYGAAYIKGPRIGF